MDLISKRVIRLKVADDKPSLFRRQINRRFSPFNASPLASLLELRTASMFLAVLAVV